MTGTFVQLLTNATGNGSDATFVGGKAVLAADATFGGGTVKLQIKLETGTYADVSNGSLSAAGVTAGLDLPAGTYRAVATTATAAYARLVRVPS